MEMRMRLQSVPPLFSASKKHTVPSSLDIANIFFPPRLDSVGFQSKNIRPCQYRYCCKAYKSETASSPLLKEHANGGA